MNEQWPEYWSSLFAQEGFLAFDCIRPAIWTKPGIDWWYAQNILLYVEKSFIAEIPTSRELMPYQVINPLSLVHPKFLERANQPKLSRIFSELIPGSLRRSVAHRLRKSTTLSSEDGG